MNADVYPSDEYESEGLTIPSARLTTPRDVLYDRTISTEEKRALLASWASDLRAVENWPALRRLDDGTELHIDDILEALKALDSLVEKDIRQSSVLPFPSHRLGSHKWPDRCDDDDDDPPPASMAVGLPPLSPASDAKPLSYPPNQWRPSAVVGR